MTKRSIKMKSLFPKQSEAHDFFVSTLLDGRSTLDSSQMGTGKTVVGAQVAKDLIDQGSFDSVAVICPKAVFPTWKAELEECGLGDRVEFILNVEKLRRGTTPYVHKVGKKNFRWAIGNNTLILIDEIHKLKGPWTQNANLLIALVKQGFKIHGMSGTPCESPMEMRPLGYMLGLHSNDMSRGGKMNYFQWLRKLRCEKGHWGGFEMADPHYALTTLRSSMYGINTHGLTVADFPDSFRDNRVLVDPVEFTNNDKIVKEYKKLNMTADEVKAYVEDGKSPDHLVDEDDPIIVKILRARQQCELYKVKDIATMAQDAVEEGYNVVVFLNFTESLRELASLVGCDYIDGSTPAEERIEYIDSFQRDETNLLAINAATGGTGISLHDTLGNRPRLSLISPSFNAKEFAQVIGRIHRNGAKSDALQKVMLSNNSIEEYVMEAINKKLNNMNIIHHSRPCEMNTTHY
jgi:superfamily II DNA or RNA helicase